MHRVLLTVSLFGGEHVLMSYRAALLTAAVLTVSVAWALARRAGMSGPSVLAAYVAAAASLPVGARLWHAVTNTGVYAEDPARLWALQPTGFALFGGILGAALGGLAAARWLGLDVWRLADSAAPALGVGIAVQRLGCFANGCCFGVPTEGPLGVTFPPGSSAHIWQVARDRVGLFEAPLPAHATQLYELAGALLCAAVALFLARRTPAGVPFLAFVALFAVVRTANWTLRAHPGTLDAPGIYWPLYPAVIVLCVALAALRTARCRRTAVAEVPLPLAEKAA